MGRHKQLLDRQHFQGPFWQGRPKPTSVLDENNPLTQVYSDEEPKAEMNPALTKPKEENWEKVKR